MEDKNNTRPEEKDTTRTKPCEAEPLTEKPDRQKQFPDTDERNQYNDLDRNVEIDRQDHNVTSDGRLGHEAPRGRLEPERDTHQNTREPDRPYEESGRQDTIDKDIQ